MGPVEELLQGSRENQSCCIFFLIMIKYISREPHPIFFFKKDKVRLTKTIGFSILDREVTTSTRDLKGRVKEKHAFKTRGVNGTEYRRSCPKKRG